VRDSLGGDIFSNIYAGLMIRLPGQAGDLGAHAHVFANGGSAVLLNSSSTAAAAAAAAAAGSSGSNGVLGALGERLRTGVQQMGSSYRWSAGEGGGYNIILLFTPPPPLCGNLSLYKNLPPSPKALLSHPPPGCITVDGAPFPPV